MGREGHCRQISLACVWSTRNVPATLGLPPLTDCMLSLSRLLYRERALSCMHFPGLSHSGSGSWVLHKEADSIGPAFCAFTGRSSSGNQQLEEHTLPRCSAPYPLRGPSLSFLARWSGAPCVSSGKLISGCDPPCRCQPSRISGILWLETGSLFALCQGMPSLRPSLPLSSSPCLWRGMGWSTAS